MLLGAEAAATRVEAREGEARQGDGQASREERGPGIAPANTRAPVTPAAPHVNVSSTTVLSDKHVRSGGTPVFAKMLDAVKANPSRFAIAAAGASLFILTKGARRDHAVRRF